MISTFLEPNIIDTFGFLSDCSIAFTLNCIPLFSLSPSFSFFSFFLSLSQKPAFVFETKKIEDVFCCHGVPYRLGGILEIWGRMLHIPVAGLFSVMVKLLTSGWA